MRAIRFVAFGDPSALELVNVAARVQTLTRVHHVDILVTESLRPELDKRFALSAMPPEVVKGVAQPVVTYAVSNRWNATQEGSAWTAG